MTQDQPEFPMAVEFPRDGFDAVLRGKIGNGLLGVESYPCRIKVLHEALAVDDHGASGFLEGDVAQKFHRSLGHDAEHVDHAGAEFLVPDVGEDEGGFEMRHYVHEPVEGPARKRHAGAKHFLRAPDDFPVGDRVDDDEAHGIAVGKLQLPAGNMDDGGVDAPRVAVVHSVLHIDGEIVEDLVHEVILRGKISHSDEGIEKAGVGFFDVEAVDLRDELRIVPDAGQRFPGVLRHEDAAPGQKLLRGKGRGFALFEMRHALEKRDDGLDKTRRFRFHD